MDESTPIILCSFVEKIDEKKGKKSLSRVSKKEEERETHTKK